MTETRSNVWCTNCQREFIATMDLSLNGNHVIVCPLCAHEHFRVVKDGVVTEDRWASSSGPVYYAITSTTVQFTALTTSSATSSLTIASWLNRSDLNLA